jgi:NAD(P)-dependent dehydrogenase (short-subunit alcohol dehydrogenase family)
MKAISEKKQTTQLFDLQGKVVVVTGGAGLIGSELARHFSDAGASTYIAEVDASLGKKVASKIAKKKNKLRVVEIDISDEKSISQCIEQVLETTDRIDAWVNCAYPKPKDWSANFSGITESAWKESIDSHLSGYFLSSRKVAEQMKLQNMGSIINFASTYGIVGPDWSLYEGTEMTMPAAYSAIKGGVISFTRYLASYYGPFNVRANTISPGGIYNHQDETFVARYAKKTPLKRMGSPRDIAGAALFLASDASAYVTGHNLVVDGGYTIV